MKRAFPLPGSLLALIAVGLIVTGCNESTSQSASNEITETSVAGQSEKNCCGACASENIAAGQSAGCCGKCSGETAAKLADGCCGKCLEESATVKTTEGCRGDCNACAEGDSANCKCDDASAADLTEGETAKEDSHVNTMPEDRDIFHFLLENHDKVTRTVTELENGVKTVTESTDAAITGKIQEHVASMYNRVEDGRPLRMWDELYREVFKHADKIKMEIENTENGISVTETSDDDYVVKLIQAHAKVVTGFTERGFDEARLNHEPPQK